MSHPLPAGMRDFLPPDARRHAELSRQLLTRFALHGYELVTLPVFEYAEVLERGLGALDPAEVLRFVEPETGAVVALRPDMTPQLARVSSTRLSGAPPPFRLSYTGSVLRRRRERARQHRQIFQAGIELIGREGPAGDLEALEVASAAARAAGLEDFVLDLGHARIAGALLEGVEPVRKRAAVEALHLKDRAELAALAASAGLPENERDALSALPELHGEGPALWALARRVLSSTRAGAALAELSFVAAEVDRQKLAPASVVDFGETRHFAYYTGTTFQLHARGPGRPVASGGRYDGLLGRFGAPMPAFGFAFGLDDLIWALGEPSLSSTPRVLLSGAAGDLSSGLRSHGICCTIAPEQDPLAYARAWRYTHVVSAAASEVVVLRVPDLVEQRAPLDAAAVARVVLGPAEVTV